MQPLCWKVSSRSLPNLSFSSTSNCQYPLAISNSVDGVSNVWDEEIIFFVTAFSALKSMQKQYFFSPVSVTFSTKLRMHSTELMMVEWFHLPAFRLCSPALLACRQTGHATAASRSMWHFLYRCDALLGSLPISVSQMSWRFPDNPSELNLTWLVLAAGEISGRAIDLMAVSGTTMSSVRDNSSTSGFLTEVTVKTGVCLLMIRGVGFIFKILNYCSDWLVGGWLWRC